jgi:hypothetical protein
VARIEIIRVRILSTSSIGSGLNKEFTFRPTRMLFCTNVFFNRDTCSAFDKANAPQGPKLISSKIIAAEPGSSLISCFS